MHALQFLVHRTFKFSTRQIKDSMRLITFEISVVTLNVRY